MAESFQSLDHLHGLVIPVFRSSSKRRTFNQSQVESYYQQQIALDNQRFEHFIKFKESVRYGFNTPNVPVSS
jgi:hypothetical protein